MADKTYYKHRTKLHGKSPIGPRLEAWTTCPLASALYGSKHWRINKELLTEVQTWELGKLRRIFAMKAPSKETYYWHTTTKLRTWYKHHDKHFAHEQILKNVFKAAWQDQHVRVAKNARPLWTVRRERTRQWWEIRKNHTTANKERNGWKHTHEGHSTSWEDILVDYLSNDWEKLAENTPTLNKWMTFWIPFRNKVCDAFNLHYNKDEKPTEADGYKGAPNKKTEPLETITEQEWHHNAYTWDKKHHGILILTDNQIIANLLNAEVVLYDETYEEHMHNMTNDLYSLWAQGYLPSRSWDSYVKWMPRKYNQTADTLCNRAMDNKQGETNSWNQTPHGQNKVNYILTVDGGHRINGDTAAGWAIWEKPEKGEPKLIYIRSIYWQNGRSAFQAEVQAMFHGLQEVMNFLIPENKRACRGENETHNPRKKPRGDQGPKNTGTAHTLNHRTEHFGHRNPLGPPTQED